MMRGIGVHGKRRPPRTGESPLAWPPMESPGTADVMEKLGARALEQVVAYLRRGAAAEGRVCALDPPEQVREALQVDRWMGEAKMDADAFAGFLETYLDATTKLHHPGFLGHQVAAPMAPSILADFVHASTNNGMAIYEMGPPAVVLEQAVLAWMYGHIGWSEDSAGGVLTNGGSLANLTAMAAARAAIAPQAWVEGTPSDLAILVPESAHYSIARAAGILGLGEAALIPIATTAGGRMDADGLPAAAARAEAEGRRIMAVSANACSTATGLYDPLDEVGAFCEERGLWFHVDGAHGASVLLSDKLRDRMRGVERADSVVWDAHKMLHVPALCAAVLLRDGARLPAAFAQQASYLGNPAHQVGTDLYPLAIECTKTALGLKLFLNIAVHGTAGISARNDQLHASTAAFQECIRARPNFESPLPVESNILVFRHRGEGVDHAALRYQLLRTGEVYLTAADVDGHTWLRFTVMNPATTVERIEALLDRIEEFVAG